MLSGLTCWCSFRGCSDLPQTAAMHTLDQHGHGRVTLFYLNSVLGFPLRLNSRTVQDILSTARCQMYCLEPCCRGLQAPARLWRADFRVSDHTVHSCFCLDFSFDVCHFPRSILSRSHTVIRYSTLQRLSIMTFKVIFPCNNIKKSLSCMHWTL